MTDRPIIFSAPMVRSLLDGHKTQTRRALKSPTRPGIAGQNFYAAKVRGQWEWCRRENLPYHQCISEPIKVTCAPGDRLWVKEAWRTEGRFDHLPPSEITSRAPRLHYDADGDAPHWSPRTASGRYRHSRFMPRWASRLTLTVTDVRVQRVQEISGEDARAEGALTGDHSVYAFSQIWNSIHGPNAWDQNPWVVALTFDVHRCNIDHMERPQ